MRDGEDSVAQRTRQLVSDRGSITEEKRMTVASGEFAGAVPRAARVLRQPTARAIRERLIELPLLIAGLLSIGTTVGIVGVLVFETWEFFQEVSLIQFLTDTQWTPLFSDKHFGISVLLSATLMTSAGAILVALPLHLRCPRIVPISVRRYHGRNRD
jgi:hypothetical protein